MTWLLIFVLIIACAKLLSDQRKLVARVDSLEDIAFARLAALEQLGVAGAAPEPAAPPARPQPRVAIVRRAPAPPVEPEPPLPEPPVPAAAHPVAEPVVPEPVQPEPVEPDLQHPEAPARGGGFEEIFGRKLPIWAGGATLAVAGFLIVKYSIDLGLLSPAIRALFGLLFGTALIAGAEAALRLEHRVRDPRVAQALSGAGVATLYATVLVATNLYQLVSPLTGFAGLALVTLLAGLLALRFGPASAVLGLVGGLSAPALVGAGPPNMPLLASYLALAVGGLCALGQSRRWWWLGASALVGGFGWGLVLILGGALDATASLSLGVYTLAIGIALPLLVSGGGHERIVRWAGALAGCAQMAALVALGGFGWLEWGLYGLISLAVVWLSGRDARLAALPAPALGVALLLLLAWQAAPAARFAAALAGATLIYGIPAFLRLWRADGRLSDALQLTALGLALPLAPWIQFGGSLTDASAAALAFMGAGLTGAAAARGWQGDRSDTRFPLLAITSAVLTVLGLTAALPQWAAPALAASVAAGLLLVAVRAGDDRVENGAWALGAFAILELWVIGESAGDLPRAVDLVRGQPQWQSALRWAVVAGAALLFAVRGRATARPVFQAFAAALCYGAVAQIVAAPVLPVVTAAAMPALAWLARGRRVEAGLVTLAMIGLGWAAAPVSVWLLEALFALGGDPMLRVELPGIGDTLTRIATVALALAATIALWPMTPRVRPIAALLAGSLGLVAVHICWKQLFGIDDLAAFAARGMAERTLWQLGFAAAAIAALRFGRREAALAPGGVALGHFALFTLLLHNPLWDAQAVGPWLVPACGAAMALLWSARRFDPGPALARARELAQMLLILVFAFTALRQLAHGSVIAWAPVGPVEDIARSVLAIALAIGFLLWGIRAAKPDWRIASLVLMLVAVAKVFLLDAAGLDGLLRILSFAALGFSLIGVGWLYSRWLPARREV